LGEEKSTQACEERCIQEVTNSAGLGAVEVEHSRAGDLEDGVDGKDEGGQHDKGHGKTHRRGKALSHTGDRIPEPGTFLDYRHRPPAVVPEDPAGHDGDEASKDDSASSRIANRMLRRHDVESGDAADSR
jgi:hypothetical protein